MGAQVPRYISPHIYPISPLYPLFPPIWAHTQVLNPNPNPALTLPLPPTPNPEHDEMQTHQPYICPRCTTRSSWMRPPFISARSPLDLVCISAKSPQVHHEIKLDATSIVNHPIVVGVPVGTVRVRVEVGVGIG